jgi:hypothetical protein
MLRSIGWESKTGMPGIVTIPMSNSISNSLRKTSGCWLRTRLGCDERKSSREEAAAAASGCLAVVKRHKCLAGHIGAFDAAARFASAALSHDVAHRLLALTATGCHAEFELKVIERIDALGDGRTDSPVGNGLAYADDHG